MNNIQDNIDFKSNSLSIFEKFCKVCLHNDDNEDDLSPHCDTCENGSLYENNPNNMIII